MSLSRVLKIALDNYQSALYNISQSLQDSKSCEKGTWSNVFLISLYQHSMAYARERKRLRLD